MTELWQKMHFWRQNGGHLGFFTFLAGAPWISQFFRFFSQNGVSTHKVIKLGGAQRVLKHWPSIAHSYLNTYLFQTEPHVTSLEQSNTKWLYALQIEFGLLSGYKGFQEDYV